MKLRYKFHIWLFNIIAPGYQWFFRSQLNSYRKLLEKFNSNLPVQAPAKVLDVGCGTGAFGVAFQEKGFSVLGIDSSEKMIKIAKKNSLEATRTNLLEPLPFPDDTFDLVIAANVMHGFQVSERKQIYQEIARISKKYALFHDYSKKRNIFVTLIEWIEHGDYFNFIRKIPEDFLQVFQEVKTLGESEDYSAWYLCTKKK
ncbi:MAG: class I SAM-dependent methyltransferase [Candidatus Lokiarchaeota archaeon]|nr:class I SAM-dependent methyltransferase [Candidatus Harpocratesius repetitus]